VESNNAACEREKELQDKVQSLESQLAKNKDKYLQSLENARNEHTAEIDEMLAQLAKNKDEYSKSLQKVRDEHTAEIDEMLEQLDIVEAEHNTKYTKLNDAVKQKEAIVSALGAQLAEATAKMTALQAEKEQDLADLAMAREEAELARAASDSLKKSLDRLRDDHKKALEEEAQRRQELCQTVKKGMILAAEEQFGKANEHYVNLKHEYDAIKEKLNKVELELKTSKRDLDRSRKEEASREVEMRAEIARLKASLATAEANFAKNRKEHMAEINSMRDTLVEAISKFEASQKQLKSSQDTLAVVVLEKQQLLKENVDLKAVSEELLAMVEGSS
jgi:chromosome segregation ATPase